MTRQRLCRWFGLGLMASMAFSATVRSESLVVEMGRHDGKNVRRVQFEGKVNLPPQRLKTLIQTREGQPFSANVANEDTKRLTRKGFICKDCTILLEGNDVVVIFTVDSEPLVDDIEFAGKVKGRLVKRFKELIQTKKGDLVRMYQINSDVRDMVKEMKTKGYHSATVEHEFLPGPTGGVTVRFTVHPGKKMRVRTLDIQGATAFTPRELRKVIKTRKKKWYSSGKYIEDVFQEDVKKLREHYWRHGWLDADVQVEKTDLEAKKGAARLAIRVQEGERYQVDSISFDGNELFTSEQLMSVTSLRAGKPYSEIVLNEDLKKMQDRYGEKGYVRNEIRPERVLQQNARKVALTYHIKEGLKTYVGAIHVAGNTKTKDIVVRREVSLIPGEEFNTLRLRDSLRRVRNLGFFEEVNADYAPGSEEQLTDVNMQVKEGKTGSFQIGAGLSSDSGFFGSIGLRQENFDYADWPKDWHDFLTGHAFVGDGQDLQLVALPGNVVKRYRIAFTEPYLFDRPILLGLSGAYFERDRDVYDERRAGGSARLGKQVIPDLHLSTSYRYEIVDISSVDEDEAPLAVLDAEGQTNISSVTLSSVYDKRDNRFLPTKGYRSELSYEIAGTVLGGNLDIHKVEAEHGHHVTFYRTSDDNPHTLSAHIRSGWEDELDDTDDIPIFERFFLGGGSSVRGFQYRTVGPQDRDQPVGGKFYYQVNLEYGFPVFGKVFRGVLFHDIGNVTPFLGSHDDFETWRASAGFGIRIQIPYLGPVPLKLDFGFPYRKETTDDDELISFQVGTAF